MTKRELAHAILDELFSGRTRITIAEAIEMGKTRDVSRSTLRRAATEQGVREVHNGSRPAFWER